nr:GNAT family N-acetyltransferase [Flavobacterium fluviatile]
MVSCFIFDDEMQFRKLATLQEFQGRGIASELLEYIYELARKKDLRRVWCNARLEKKYFYEKLGMKDTFEICIKSGQEYTIMEMWL